MSKTYTCKFTYPDGSTFTVVIYDSGAYFLTLQVLYIGEKFGTSKVLDTPTIRDNVLSYAKYAMESYLGIEPL
jgi:hypothetical protein